MHRVPQLVDSRAKTSVVPKPDLETGRKRQGKRGERERKLGGNFSTMEKIDSYSKCTLGYNSV